MRKSFEKEMTNYFGGYYLLRLKKFDYGRLKDKEVYTCSDCTNDSLINRWSFSWTTKEKDELENIQKDFQIDKATVGNISVWTDKKLESKAVGWVNVFADLQTVKEYRNQFFSHMRDTKIFSLYFSESEALNIIEEFKPKENSGSLGIWDNLTKKKDEANDPKEVTIGYDLIGIELSGDFHSFNCHDIADELVGKFGVAINNYGLIEEQKDWKRLIDYMNDEANGHEPVPWYVCKVKMRLE
jgi:hypothetical protein